MSSRGSVIKLADWQKGDLIYSYSPVWHQVQFIDVFFRFYIFVRVSLGRNCVKVWGRYGWTTKKPVWMLQTICRRAVLWDWLSSDESIARNQLPRVWGHARKPRWSVWTLTLLQLASRERVYDHKARCFQVSKPEGSMLIGLWCAWLFVEAQGRV